MSQSGLSALASISTSIIPLAGFAFVMSFLIAYISILLPNLLPVLEEKKPKEPKVTSPSSPYGSAFSLVFKPEGFLRRLQ